MVLRRQVNNFSVMPRRSYCFLCISYCFMCINKSCGNILPIFPGDRNILIKQVLIKSYKCTPSIGLLLFFSNFCHSYLIRSVKAQPSTQFSTNDAPCLWVTNCPSRNLFSILFCRVVFFSKPLWKMIYGINLNASIVTFEMH